MWETVINIIFLTVDVVEIRWCQSYPSLIIQRPEVRECTEGKLETKHRITARTKTKYEGAAAGGTLVRFL